MVLKGKEARETLYKGVKGLKDVVAVTMGPEGQNVFFSPDKITHDGVTAARQFKIEGPAEIGANLIRQASERLDSEQGDGTTTATVLTEAIVRLGLEEIEAGKSPMKLKQELDQELPALLKQLDEMKLDIEDGVFKAATVAANDPEIGKMVSELIIDIGEHGAVNIQLGDEEIEIEKVPGLVIPHGYITPNESQKNTVELDKPLIAVFGQNLTTNEEAINLMTQADKMGSKNVVVFAPVIRGDALHTFAANTLKGVMNVLCVKTGGLDDIALFTGAVIPDLNKEFDEQDFGTAKLIKSNGLETSVIEGGADPELLKTTVEQLRDNDEEIRAAYLSGESAIIKVGGNSLAEKEEKLYRIEDAVGSARSALIGGVVEGGGFALAKTQCESLIMQNVLKAPFEQLAENFGGEFGTTPNIVDPLNIVKETLKTAVSVAGQILTAGAIIYDYPDKE